MKLTRAIGKLEGAAKNRAPKGRAVGLVWTVDEAVIARELAPGEFLAVDVHRLGPDGDGWCGQRTVERVTDDPGDLGFVYDAGGAKVGRVVRHQGSLLTTEISAAGGGR